MILALLLAGSPPPQTSHVFPGGDEDAARGAAEQPGCDPAAEEITVCGNSDSARFRARPLSHRFDPKPIRAQFDLPGGVKGRVDAVQRGVGPGVSVPGALVTLKIPLGKRARKPPE